MLRDLYSEISVDGGKMNRKKSKAMVNRHAESLSFGIGNGLLEEVKQYNYVGHVASAGPNLEKEIRRGSRKGWQVFGKHSQKMATGLPLSLKREVYNQCVLPVATHEAATWGLAKPLERKPRSAMKITITAVTLWDRKRASNMREQTRVEDTAAQIKRKK